MILDGSGVEGGTELPLLVSGRSSRTLPGAAESSRSDEFIQVRPFLLSHQQKPKVTHGDEQQGQMVLPEL